MIAQALSLSDIPEKMKQRAIEALQQAEKETNLDQKISILRSFHLFMAYGRNHSSKLGLDFSTVAEISLLNLPNDFSLQQILTPKYCVSFWWKRKEDSCFNHVHSFGRGIMMALTFLVMVVIKEYSIYSVLV